MRKLSRKCGLYVQYGCGDCAPANWTNFDSSPTLRLEKIPVVGRLYTKNAKRFLRNVKYGDIIIGLPVPDRSCSGVFCSHVLEHLSLEDFRIALLNTHRLLRHKGIFRLVVPDLRLMAERYLADSSPMACHEFMNSTCLGVLRRKRGLKNLLTSHFGNSKHLFMWDFKALEHELEVAGFAGIRKCELGDCCDQMFDSVESAERFKNAVAIECTFIL